MDASAVLQLTRKFTFQTIDYMSFFTPMVGQVTFTIFYHSDPQALKLNGLPIGNSGLTLVLRPGNSFPINYLKGYVLKIHAICFFLKLQPAHDTFILYYPVPEILQS